jgi:hypothetical protein
MAGFAETESLLASTDGCTAAESVITSMAGSAGFGRPHPTGGRMAIPACYR